MIKDTAAVPWLFFLGILWLIALGVIILFLLALEQKRGGDQ